jgi:outer membrane murein-binding lipoprotein Lpp
MQKYIFGILIFALIATIFLAGCISKKNVDNFDEVDDLQNITDDEQQISGDLENLSLEDPINKDLLEIDNTLKELDTLLDEPVVEIN